ncbi:MAG: hypothetical protein GEV05_22515 [Betaproteobacteria bacterium]|nr:hypothetical protein [Betaproteobacteria bacterium]
MVASEATEGRTPVVRPSRFRRRDGPGQWSTRTQIDRSGVQMSLKPLVGCAAAIVVGVFGIVPEHRGALANDFPTKPLRLIVPFPPGGLNDLLARLLGTRLAERLGAQVVIDNRPGANTIIGTEMTARATPDGYTFMIVPVGHAVNPSVYRTLPYDTIKDLRGVAFIGDSLPCHSVSFQLEPHFCGCRPYTYQLPVPAARRQHQEGTDRRVSQSAQGALEASTAGDLGWFAGTSQPPRARVSGQPERTHPDCVPAALRTRSQSACWMQATLW